MLHVCPGCEIQALAQQGPAPQQLFQFRMGRSSSQEGDKRHWTSGIVASQSLLVMDCIFSLLFCSDVQRD